MDHLAEVRIDLNAIKFNLDQIRKRVGVNKPVMVMIKADAYGHGAVELARYYQKQGITDFGVAHVYEAQSLRQAGVKGRILVLQPGFLTNPEAYVKWDLEAVINHVEDLERLTENVKCHLMVDTGMSREGVLPQDVMPVLEKLRGKEHIELTGICTHFAKSDESGPSFTIKQINRFEDVLQSLPDGLRQRLTVHAANSGAIVNFKKAYYDMVRPGILLYGIYSGFGKIQQRAAMSVYAKLIIIKTVGKGACVGYGCTFEIDEPTTLGVLGLGYADGLSRSHSNRGWVWRGNESFDILGRVSMDQVVFNLHDHDDLPIGTEFLVYGGHAEHSASLFHDADMMGTITYERACQLGMRLPKVFVERAE